MSRRIQLKIYGKTFMVDSVLYELFRVYEETHHYKKHELLKSFYMDLDSNKLADSMTQQMIIYIAEPELLRIRHEKRSSNTHT